MPEGAAAPGLCFQYLRNARHSMPFRAMPPPKGMVDDDEPARRRANAAITATAAAREAK